MHVVQSSLPRCARRPLRDDDVVTVDWLVRRAELGLTVAAGNGSLDRRIDVVHSSEQADPTPWLRGGALLLTTGMWLDVNAPGDASHYVRRLASAGVRGLGFGVGVHHERIPAELLSTAEQTGLPVLSVPRPTSFIAVSEALRSALAHEEHEQLLRGVRAQVSLATAAATSVSPRVIVERLSGALESGVALLDRALEPRVVAGPDTAALLRICRAEAMTLGRTGPHDSLSRAERTMHVAVLPLVVGGVVRGQLAVGRISPFSSVEHQVVHTAVALLCAGLAHSRAVRGSAMEVRSVVVRLLMTGHEDMARELGYETGADLPATPMRVTVARASEGRLYRLLEEVDDTAELVESKAFVTTHDGHGLLVLTPARSWPRAALDACLLAVPGTRAVSAVARTTASLSHCFERITAAMDQAPAGMILDLEAAPTRTLLELLRGPDHREWARRTLEPVLCLPGSQREESLRLLKSWLTHGGSHDLTARELDIHRNTLRPRLDRLRALLGVDIEDPDRRMSVWLALRVLDND